MRQSNFELLRLLSQYFIVLYHVLHFYLQPHHSSLAFKALQMPLHIGVVVFVLLSGYFSIKPSSKGFLRFLAILFVYSLPNIVHGVLTGQGALQKGLSLLFLSNTRFWFVRTYLYLYLVSPMLNEFLGNGILSRKWYLLAALGFISVWIAQFRTDPSLELGKNLVHFMFLYTLGRLLHEYQERWQRLSTFQLAGAYLFLNLLIVTTYLFLPSLRPLTWRLCFYYTSPILILNAILLFLFFGKLQFQSAFVNHLATSCFAIYLLHSTFYARQLLAVAGRALCQNIHSDIPLFGAAVLLALLVVTAIILIDNLLLPVWKASQKLGQTLYLKLGF